MTETTTTKRLARVAKELGVGAHTIIDHLISKGFDVENKPTTKLTEEMYLLLLRDFQKDKTAKEKADQIELGHGETEQIEIDRSKVTGAKKPEEQEEVFIKNLDQATETAPPPAPPTPKTPEKEAKKDKDEKPEEITSTEEVKLGGLKIKGKVELDKSKKTPPPAEDKKAPEEKEKEPEKPKEEEVEIIKGETKKLDGLTVKGKIELPEKKEKKPVASSTESKDTERRKKKRKRTRIVPEGQQVRGDRRGKSKKGEPIEEVSEKEIKDKIKETQAKLSGTGKGQRAKIKKIRRSEKTSEQEIDKTDESTIQVTEFISVAELASILDVDVSDVIGKCFSLGIMVSINQRLDAEVIELVAGEYDYDVKFINVDDGMSDEEMEEDDPKDLVERPPIVTIMGHVDHGKTSLLDYIRKTNVIAGEVGGITQHIGAYEVNLDGKLISFLDTPGHEAFTAMRARGAKITDIVVVVVAADDGVMPQTKEAISHAQAAGVPIIFAINKIDKEGANPEKIKELLAGMNLLVEDWGGNYQSQDLSAKTGKNVEELLEKILVQAELLELKANPDKNAIGSIIEASLDKGRGYVATVLVQEGTLKKGDIMLAGSNMGKIKAMYNERGAKIESAGPSTPVQILGLDGAPQAGEKFRVMDNEQDAKSKANKRAHIEREQGMRATKHITLEEIGRRLALGTFKELNIIVKGDVDGSIEALSDSLLKLSTKEIGVNIIHKGVGQITETDVMLASASDAIIIGFQVRPSLNARKEAEKEHIEIRLYSIIYNAIEEIKSAMEGMLEPKIEEKIIGNVEVREVYKITRVGTVAGCYVTDGKVLKSSMIRLIRDGIVVYSGLLASLKRFKDDAREVKSGMECGISIKDYNDIKVGDVIEAYEEIEVKRTL